ncbi:HTH-type transcriptional regulator DmlR [Rhodopseudomonas palustris]|uniref:LysR family transcriptional regulator n=1 Tax=Rhodopseudomonas palustris (strain ATCC BAA-98 / CGA009) TaxID=258594 RepID=Q6N0L5_RHOPA|nr:LysR family transcriptional regulator [Rhodopseudomonas palustris]OPF95617.1 LysR family transcriptional regulator [Rhodopseudomonas palustris]QQM06323.1 HTH-type transcriptional regulator DmlR [Rhodopseudomonas palustris]RJF68835.1 LysR family transcriptional regulator [Rhodopseudomonas palustris]WAB77638.1 LysR family transcriptional regulator [Rhodopseudomonas palustris]WCL94953.1 LysR family transcriptional regulator [Rhodopseudomonas palustris CGA009]
MDKSAVTIERIRTFVRIAERGSLSAVARDLNVGQSTVTRQLQELEAAVGAPLLSRTTRRVTLTEEGSRYYARCVQILRLLEQAGDEALGASGTPAGTIRISCTASFGVLHASRLIFAFQDRYPDIGIDFGLTDQRVDLVREGVDLAIRLAPLTDSSLKLRTLGHSHRLLVASPDYLAAHGKPTSPQDLSNHQGVRMVNVAGSDLLVLQGPDQEIHRVPFGGRLRVDHGLAAREAMIAGRGIAATHRWLVDDLLAAGRLEVLLPEYRLPPVPLNLLIVPERAGIARVRLLIDFLAEQIGSVPGIA